MRSRHGSFLVQHGLTSLPGQHLDKHGGQDVDNDHDQPGDSGGATELRELESFVEGEDRERLCQVSGPPAVTT